PRPTQRPEDLGEAVPSVQAGARTVRHLLRRPHLPMRTLGCPDQARAQGWHHRAAAALSTTPPRGSSRRFNLYCGVDTALTSQQRRSALHGVTQKVGQPPSTTERNDNSLSVRACSPRGRRWHTIDAAHAKERCFLN